MNSHLDIDVIPGDDLLSANLADLDLDVHNAQGLCANIDLHKTRINGLVELTET